MKSTCLIFSLIFTFSSLAESSQKIVSKLSPEERAARRDKIVMERFGGYVTVPGTPSGSIVIFDGQSRVTADTFDISKIKGLTRIKSLVKTMKKELPSIGDAEGIMKREHATFALFIVDSKSLPMSLVAPEAQWAVMNVAPLGDGSTTEELMKVRARNEFLRVFGMLCGGLASQFKAPLTNFVKSPKDLETCGSEFPVDYPARMLPYLEYRDVKPLKQVFYEKACQEGWAAKPTNDFQKAIWDKVHALPTNPIKIKPETKPVKE